jgi:pimeloyl-ACP methyl ester carboxylesterase
MKDDLYYTDEGSGEITLVFLHYFGGSSRTWKKVIELLKVTFRCIAIDLPGFGFSAPLSGTATVERVAEKIAGLLKKVEIKKYVLVGHSMGGKIVMQLASLSLPTIQQVVLVAPSPPTPEPANDAKRKELLDAHGDRKALEKLAKGLLAKPLTAIEFNAIIEDNLRIHKMAWSDWINVGSKEDISPQLKNIQVPVTVISGQKDPNFPTQFLQKEIGCYLPQAKFIEIENAGHLLPVEAPGLVADVVNKTIVHLGKSR